jgi:uncharacterized protein
MQFMVTAYDGTDAEAPARRLAARSAHLKLVDESIARGEQIFGAAILDEEGNMRGSLMIMNFPSRAMLDAWLAREPYIQANVWQTIEIKSCAIPPSFSHLVKK